ncbi:MAG TPA: hypothetical protein VLM89_16555 [Phycisphaerae bacterium]|nr:hypothetical protein [Phycisphaerae bacterium]
MADTAAILEFERQYPLEGYRRLAFMMLDADVVAASPSSVYRVLKQAGRLEGWNRKLDEARARREAARQAARIAVARRKK